MRTIMLVLGAIALSLGSGCALLQPPQEIVFQVDPSLPPAIQEVQKKVLNARIDLAAFRLTVDDREKLKLITADQAAKLRAKIKEARDALNKVDEAIALKNFADAVNQSNLQEAAIRLLEREIAEAVQEAK